MGVGWFQRKEREGGNALIIISKSSLRIKKEALTKGLKLIEATLIAVYKEKLLCSI